MPALPVARARRRTRARSLNTVTSAMRASTIAAPSAVSRRHHDARHLLAARLGGGRRDGLAPDHRGRGGDERERTAARAQFAGIRASVIVRRPG